MSNEIERLSDPGLPEHQHRATDIDPVAEKKAERQVALYFALSAVGTIVFVYSYIFVPITSFVFV